MIRVIPNPYETESGCFFCGPENEHGLHLVFRHDEEAGEVFAEYVVEPRFQGAGRLLHGGMQMGLLDECMWWACVALAGEKNAVTVRAEVKFLRPVHVGSRIRVSCTLVEHAGNAIRLRGKVVDERGKVCSAVRGEYRVLGPEHFERILAEAPD